MPAPLPGRSASAHEPPGAERSSNRRTDIQGLRAIAVLVVVAFHAGLPVPGGFVGVDVFFVISGFVITGMLHREWVATGTIRFREFYLRRFKRLTPALALMVVVVLLISALALSPLGTQQVAAKTAAGTMLLVANFVIARNTGGYFDAAADTNPLLNTWSLSVEEQFYLVFPAVVALGWLLARRARVLRAAPAVIIGVIAVASFALAVLVASGRTSLSPSWMFGFYSPFTRAWEFAVGALLAIALAKARVLSQRVALLLGLAGLALVAASLWLITGTTPFPGPWTLLPVAGSLLLLAAGTQAANPVSRLLSTRPMIKVGDWSYSIYLWHWPLIVFAALAWPGSSAALLIAAAVSFAPALISYRWVEQPIRALRALSWRRLALVIVATLAPPLALSAALYTTAQHGFWIPSIQQYQAATTPLHAGLLSGCDTRVAQLHRAPGECTWNAELPGAPVYLIGDSNSDHFHEGVQAAAAALDRPLIANTTNACPYADVYLGNLRGTTQFDEGCRAYVADTTTYLTSSPRGLVVIANSDSYWKQDDLSVGLTPDDQTKDRQAKLADYEVGLTKSVRALEAAGQQVLLVQTTPKWTGEVVWNPLECSTITLANGSCNVTMTTAQAASNQGAARAVVDRVAASTGATVIDTWPALCPDGTCTTQEGTLVRYRDQAHISVPQSLQLEPLFSEAFARVQQR